jgi:hypothetical protein
MLVYINNIIIFSKDIKTYIQDLFIVLLLLYKSGITLNLYKCHFTQLGL